MSGQAFTLTRTTLADRLELAKPRITAMVVFTALVGFVTAGDGAIRGAALAAALVGTGLVAAGAAVLNQVLERDTDALMDRTRHRPLPAGRVTAVEAVAFGAAVTLAGDALLFAVCGPLPAAVAFATWASYLFVYTPLKRRTPLATLVGAVPGALPPVIGWTARTGSPRPGRLHPLRDPLPLAGPPLPRDRLDVPRRLREGRLPDAAGARPRGQLHRPPGGRATASRCCS